jgi:carbonic anhydrase
VDVAGSPTQRSLAALRLLGYEAAVVEKWNPHAKIRQDMFGFVDIVAIRENETLAVQATSGTNVSSRVDKITDSPLLAVVRKAGWRVEVHGWRKGSNGRYVQRVVDMS